MESCGVVMPSVLQTCAVDSPMAGSLSQGSQPWDRSGLLLSNSAFWTLLPTRSPLPKRGKGGSNTRRQKLESRFFAHPNDVSKCCHQRMYQAHFCWINL